VDVPTTGALVREVQRLRGVISEERTLVSSLQGGIVEQTVRADEAEAARERQRELKMEAHARASELRTELEDVEADNRKLRAYAVTATEALEAYLAAKPQCECTDPACPMQAARIKARAALAKNPNPVGQALQAEASGLFSPEASVAGRAGTLVPDGTFVDMPDGSRMLAIGPCADGDDDDFGHETWNHVHTFCPHCKPCRKAERLAGFEDAMVRLASWLGHGPGSAEATTPEDMEERIRQGVETMIRVETSRHQSGNEWEVRAPFVGLEGEPLELVISSGGRACIHRNGKVHRALSPIEDKLVRSTLAVASRLQVGRDVTDAAAERFCALVNWHPDGLQSKVVEGQWHDVTFRELAKGYIRAALEASQFVANSKPKSLLRDPVTSQPSDAPLGIPNKPAGMA
jgi:hypothetical protein